LSFECREFNVEADTWPYADDSFDLVLCMEILEHLQLDPCFAFREAHRVLKPGGSFVVTTPNLASHMALYNLTRVASPYGYGLYSKNGAYGRHNREFVPPEIRRIGESSGFRTEVLETRDVYELDPAHNEALAFARRMDDRHSALRGQNIFYRGAKVDRPFDPYPAELFDYDPSEYSARLRLVALSSGSSPGAPFAGRIAVQNTGRVRWEASGDELTRIGVMLLSADGELLERDFRRIDIDESIEPGASREIEFSLDPPADAGDYLLRFDMVREQVTWFSDIRRQFVDAALVFP